MKKHDENIFKKTLKMFNLIIFLDPVPYFEI